MLMLSIETSHPRTSVALFEENRVIRATDCEKFAVRYENTSRTIGASAILAPMIQSLFKETGREPSEVGVVAVATGPGSFTGLRVGVVTAKSFAYAMDSTIIGINVLEIMAAQALSHTAVPETTKIAVAINAQRKQLFVNEYSRNENAGLRCPGPARLTERTEWIESLEGGTLVSGTGIKPLIDQFPNDVRLADESCWHPTAETVGRLADSRLAQGEADDLWKLAPVYFRPSSAEEKRDVRKR